jgi:acetyl-CoA carboxylase carboxyltransferase component
MGGSNDSSSSKTQSSPSQSEPTPTPSQVATSRLNQVSGQLKSRKKNKDARPADYSDVLGQIETIKTMAATPNPENRGYILHKFQGKLWVRERVEALFDPGSVKEIGSVAGTVTWKTGDDGQEKPEKFVPSNNVQGFGKLRGRRCVFTADDFSIRAGHADGALMYKTMYLEKLALAMKLPIIKLVDGSSGGGSVTLIRQFQYAMIPSIYMFNIVLDQLNAGIPNLGAVVGPAIGLGAARVASCHFTVMANDIGSLFNAGPKVIEGTKQGEELTLAELGGPMVHCRNGTIDNMAENEQECFEQLRTVLSYLPNSGAQLPPILASTDPFDRKDLKLRTIIPRRKQRMYNVRTIIQSVVDNGIFFEIGALWGTTVVVGLARLDGRVIGIIANNCEVNAGALDAHGSQKYSRHLKLCDVMNIPILQLVDCPGYAIGWEAEQAATMKFGVELAKTLFDTTMPIFSVIMRKAFGVAGAVMLDSRDPKMRVAWPSGDWGSLPLDGGIEVGHRAELRRAEEAGRKDEVYKQLEDDYVRLSNPVRTANNFGIEEIIDPAETRSIVCSWLKHV